MFVLIFEFINSTKLYVLDEHGSIQESFFISNIDDNSFQARLLKYKIFLGGMLCNNSLTLNKFNEFAEKILNIKLMNLSLNFNEFQGFLPYQSMIFSGLIEKYKKDFIYVDISNELSIYSYRNGELSYKIIATHDLLESLFLDINKKSPFALHQEEFFNIIINGACNDESKLIVCIDSKRFLNKEFFLNLTKVNFIEKDFLLSLGIKKLKTLLSS